jgi:hypothetical protein
VVPTRAEVRRGPGPAHPFTESVSGSEHDGLAGDGSAVVDLALRAGHARERVRVRLAGQALQGGGVTLGRSSVTLHHGGSLWSGRISALNGNIVDALVGAPDGRALRLRLALDLSGPVVRGRLVGRPLAAEGSG